MSKQVCWVCKMERPEASLKHAVGVGWHCLDKFPCRERRDADDTKLARLEDRASPMPREDGCRGCAARDFQISAAVAQIARLRAADGPSAAPPWVQEHAATGCPLAFGHAGDCRPDLQKRASPSSGKEQRVPWCKEHGPDKPGKFAHCLACSCRELSRALSQIDAAVDVLGDKTDPNYCASYDAFYDELGVVERVKAFVESTKKEKKT